jgi:hypothetical protein
MILYPKIYLDDAIEITPEFMKERNLKGIILDVDNTVMNKRREMKEGVREWIDSLKAAGIKIVIVSNTNHIDKVEKSSKVLGLDYFHFSMKPLKRGFKKAKKYLDLKNEEIAVVGDQVFTDVLGGNRCHMYTILVKPLSKEDVWATVLNRKMEKIVLKRYKKKLEKEEQKNVHK